MNAADVIGYVVEDEHYCPDCTPFDEGPDAHPIFGDSETDSLSHCTECGELIPENLTSEGFREMLATAKLFLVRRAGNVEVQLQWHKHCQGYAGTAEELTIMAMWGEALSAQNTGLTCVNVKGWKL